MNATTIETPDRAEIAREHTGLVQRAEVFKITNVTDHEEAQLIFRDLKAAQKRGVMVGFEASVGGGIPIIKAVREGLAANRIDAAVAGPSTGAALDATCPGRTAGVDRVVDPRACRGWASGAGSRSCWLC